jgi:hypothetical protein
MENEIFGISPRYAAYKADTRIGLVKTQYNREEHPCNYETGFEPSQTIPDQTMSMRTLIERYTRGLPINVSQYQSTYQEGEDFDPTPDPLKMDLSERMEFADQAREELNQIKEKLNTKRGKSSVEPKALPEVDPTPTEATPQAVEQKDPE